VRRQLDARVSSAATAQESVGASALSKYDRLARSLTLLHADLAGLHLLAHAAGGLPALVACRGRWSAVGRRVEEGVSACRSSSLAARTTTHHPNVLEAVGA
jgi:hypothetical protein